MLSSSRAVLLYTAVIGAAACSEAPPTAAPPIGVPPPAPDAAMLGSRVRGTFIDRGLPAGATCRGIRREARRQRAAPTE